MVDIDEWLEAARLQDELRAVFERQQTPEALYEPKPKECLECAKVARHLRDDYICVDCRVILEAEMP